MNFCSYFGPKGEFLVPFKANLGAGLRVVADHEGVQVSIVSNSQATTGKQLMSNDQPGASEREQLFSFLFFSFFLPVLLRYN